MLGLVSVVLLSYLGIMMSWGLAFGLPWTLAYFYFIWICPAHQLSMGIRKCKPHRMMWWLASTFLHIVPITVILTSYAILPKSLIDQEETSHERIVLTLSLILAILTFFEVNLVVVSSLSDNFELEKINFPVIFLLDLSFSQFQCEILMNSNFFIQIAGNIIFTDNCYLRDLHRSKGEEKTREPWSWTVFNCNIQSQVAWQCQRFWQKDFSLIIFRSCCHVRMIFDICIISYVCNRYGLGPF